MLLELAEIVALGLRQERLRQAQGLRAWQRGPVLVELELA